MLFAFFVVMFAASQVDKERMAMIGDAYSAHLRGETAVGLPLNVTVAPAPQQIGRMLSAAEIAEIHERISEKLAVPIAEEKVALSVQPRGLVLSMREAAFFDPGQETFRSGATGLLALIGEAVQEISGQPIRLEGHTDNVPIRTGRFPSNWELSTARAIEALKLLTAKFSISPERISIAGYGEHRPTASNDDPEGRAANRRVDIVILSKSAAATAPRQRLDDLKPRPQPDAEAP